MKELKDLSSNMALLRYLPGWNPVKELKAGPHPPSSPGSPRAGLWNPVKELKGNELESEFSRQIEVESGEGIESVKLRHRAQR